MSRSLLGTVAVMALLGLVLLGGAITFILVVFQVLRDDHGAAERTPGWDLRQVGPPVAIAGGGAAGLIAVGAPLLACLAAGGVGLAVGLLAVRDIRPLAATEPAPWTQCLMWLLISAVVLAAAISVRLR